MPDRTLDSRKRQDSTNARVRRFRARKRAEREAAEHAARVRATAERREATRIKVAAHRAKKAAERAALDAIVKDAWFAPPIDLTLLQASLPAEHASTLLAGYERASTWSGVNVNAFTVKHGTMRAEEQRTVFAEAIEAGASLADACKTAETTRFVPVGDTPIKQTLDRQTRYQRARERWRDGEEIIDALMVTVQS